ncbi:MAG: HD domain-containing protein [Lachnospiraceae bacterium]|nr:HD domain-containing protein [Lachnospiraceae bacterium]
MRDDILEYIQKDVYERSIKPSNKFGIGCYYHIVAVVKNGELLAERYGADKEVVAIASWLHDIASITDYSMYENHHIYGAEIAKQILAEFDYEPEKIELVQKCIRSHRGSVYLKRLSLEEKCVADADAISHFDSIPSLLYLAYVEKRMNIQDGIDFVKSKLERSYEKLSEESKVYYQEKYQQGMALLTI